MYKKIVKDMFVTFASTIFVAALGFVASILIPRLLGPANQGAVRIITIFPMLMLTFMNIGIDTAVIYFSAKERNFLTIDRLVNRISLCFLLIVAVAGPAVILIGRSYFQGIPLVYLFSVLLLVPLNFYQAVQLAIIRAENQYLKYNLVNAVKQGVYFLVILTVAFVRSIWVVIAANYAMALVGIAMCKFRSRHEDAEPGRRYLRDMLKFGGKSYVSNIVNFLNYRFDVLYMKPFVSLTDLGVYSVAESLSEQIWMIPNSVSVVLLPRLAAAGDEERRSVSLRVCRYVATIMFFISVVAVLLSGIFFPLLYSNKYSGAIQPFRLLMIGTFLMSYGKILGNAIAAYGKPEKNIVANVSGTLSNIVLNIILLPKYGIMGAAIAGTISYSILSVVTVIMFFNVNQYKVRLIDMLFMNGQDFKAVFELARGKLKERRSK